MQQIIRKATKHCLELLMKSRCASLPFHNATHTLEVSKNVFKIGTYANISIKELEPIILAALFHDTGNANVFEGHEDFGIMDARAFLATQNYPIDKTNLVLNCIRATRMPQNPKSLYDEILCDADLFHLGTRSFASKNELLRREWDIFFSMAYSEEEWLKLNIDFLQQHKFHTSYGKEILELGKQENIKKLKARLNKLNLV